MVRLPGLGGRKPGPALGRPAPARRARARDRQPPARAAARRAARRARPQAAPGDAGRAQAHPAGGRHHLRLRHARPGGGADDERPPGGVQRRPDRAGRRARRGLRAPGDRVHRRLRRRLERARARRPAVHDPAREGAAARRRRTTGCTRRRASCATWPTPGWSRGTWSTSRAAASFRSSARTSSSPRRAGARPAGPAGDRRMERGADVRDPARRAREARKMGGASLSATAALALVVGCGGDDDESSGSGSQVKAPEGAEGRDGGRRGRGQGQPDRLGRLRRGRVDRPEGRLGVGLREGDGLPGQRQDRQHVGRDGHADALGPVRRRVGVGRRDAAADRRRRRRAGQHRPDPELRRRLRRR